MGDCMVWHLGLFHSLVAKNAHYGCDKLRSWLCWQQLAGFINMTVCEKLAAVLFLFFLGIILTPIFLFWTLAFTLVGMKLDQLGRVLCGAKGACYHPLSAELRLMLR